MDLKLGMFYFLASLLVSAALMVILSKNPVRQVLFLILSFVLMGPIWLMLEAEFLAVTLVLVYVGAVMVLFLFVVMMLDIEIESFKSGFTRYLPLGIVTASIFIASIIYSIDIEIFKFKQLPLSLPYGKSSSDLYLLGKVLFTKYIFAFELSGVMLLTAIIGVISLTFRDLKRKRPLVNNAQNVSKKDRLKIITDHSIQEGL